MKIAVICRKNGEVGASHDDIIENVNSFISVALDNGIDVVVDVDTKIICEPNVPAQSDNDIYNCNVIVIFGGDGSVIDAAKRFPEKPLIGVNMGRLGFVSDIPKTVSHTSIIDIIKNPKSHTYGVRSMLESFMYEDKTINSIALNEISISQSNGRIIEFDVFIDNEKAYRCRGDGLIISTPTGSTAYAMSAGGAIIHPSANVIELVPLVPQTLSCRPLIVNNQSRVSVKLIKGEASCSADGKKFCNLLPRQQIEVQLSSDNAVFLHPIIPEITYSYFGMLREKLNWQHLPGGHE
jgi:NAD+ kinase